MSGRGYGGTSSSVAPAPAGGCGCEASMAGEGFVRPRFFGGMLLTEDDLQAVVDYDRAKRRLTNRHVIGAGVVCGLEVTCHPCASRKVVVDPGYAIECCGNDILVACREEVDIIDLVRDLRLRTGVDCGEPCQDRPDQSYTLYVRYTEQPTAPVAPYATDDCAAGECEFSRIREGYCFELRCDPPLDEATLLDALEACRPDKTAREDAAHMVRSMQLARAFQHAAQPVVKQEIPAVPTAKEIEGALKELDLADRTIKKLEAEERIRVRETDGVLVAAEPEDTAVVLEAGDRVRAGVELSARALNVLALDAAADAPSPGLNPAQRKMLNERGPKLAERVEAALSLRALPVADQQRTLRIAGAVRSDLDLTALNPIDRVLLTAEGLTALEADQQFVRQMQQVRAHTAERLAAVGSTTCQEYRAVNELAVRNLDSAAKRATQVLARGLLRSISACMCAAFNPPCPTCTDDAVALATVRVEGCDVVDVCALERRWVLSPRALGYWFPVVDKGRRHLQDVCCSRKEPAGPADPTEPVEQASDEIRRATALLTNAMTPTVADHQAALKAIADVEWVAPVAAPPLSLTAPPVELQELVSALGAEVRELRKQVNELEVQQPGDGDGGTSGGGG